MLWILFGVVATILVYAASRYTSQKLKLFLLNPILLSIVILIVILLISGISYDDYNTGGQVITYLLGPIVVLLSAPLYQNRDKIKAHLLPIIIGIASGIGTTFISVYVLCKVFNLEQVFVDSLYAKSITTPLAIEVTKMLGGIQSITIVAVIVTGIIGATIAPVVIKVMNIKNDIAKGIGIGSASHGIGTSKAVEMGNETAGASGLAMSITGIATVLIASFFLSLW